MLLTRAGALWMSGLLLLKERRSSQHDLELLHGLGQVFELDMCFDDLLIFPVPPGIHRVRCDRFELLDDLEHLHFEHGTRQFVKPVVARLESNALTDLLDEVQIKLCLVVVQRIQEIWGRDDVRVEGRELRRVQSL